MLSQLSRILSFIMLLPLVVQNSLAQQICDFDDQMLSLQKADYAAYQKVNKSYYDALKAIYAKNKQTYLDTTIRVPVYFHVLYRANQVISNEQLDEAISFLNEVKEYNTTQSSFERSGFQHMPWYRNRIALQVPLNHTKLMPKTFYLKLSEEVFFGFSTNAQENAFVQNRFISGAGYVINNRQKLEVDYLLQRLNKADGIRAERNHTPQFKYLLHFERKKK